MRYTVYERPLMQRPDYTIPAYESDNLTACINFCSDWCDCLEFVITDNNGTVRDWRDWEEFE